jgi:hypothetical protein
MFLKRRLAAFGLALAASAGGFPVALSTAATSPATDPVITGPSCPPGYAGPTNLATGCPYWTMSYTVQYPGQPSFQCPAYTGAPRALPGVYAPRMGGAAAGSVARVADACSVVPRAN